jgi:2-phosphosulfolactate phosphatase
MKTTEIRAHLLPQLVEPAELAGGLAIVIDVLRATTTITAALAAGAREVIPCLEIDDARRWAANLPSGQTVLGGERQGVRIEGFDHGNSPREYTAQAVGGRTVVFTTTNGTRAMLHARAAREVRLGAFVNLSAVVAIAARHERVDLICSGTGGKITREDVLLAGAIAARLTAAAAAELNDQAAIARAAWLEAMDDVGADSTALAARLAATLRETQGGRNLKRLGLESDIDDAAALDRFSIVPKLEPIATSAAVAEYCLRIAD